MGRKNTVHILAALALLAAFAVGMLGCLLAGAKSYGRLTQNSDRAYTRRTAAAYLHTQLSRAEAVSAEPFGEGMALCLHETVDGHAYTTRIYCRSGWLMELFAREGSEFSPEDGRQVLELEWLQVSDDGEMLTVRFSDGDTQQCLLWMKEKGYEE